MRKLPPLRISPFWRVVRVQGVPTSPYKPNLERFGQHGEQKQLYKGFGFHRCLASTSIANLHAPRSAHVVCVCARATSCPLHMQGEGRGIEVSMQGLTVAATALPVPTVGLRTNPPAAEPSVKFTSETRLHSPEACGAAGVMAPRRGLRRRPADTLDCQTPLKVSTF